MAGAKRKAETIKEGPSKGSKKPKIDAVQGLNPSNEENGSIRPEKTDTVARRLIAGALGLPVPNKNNKREATGSNEGKETNVVRAKDTKGKVHSAKDVKVQTQTDSSDDEFNDISEDGGVALEESDNSQELEEASPTGHEGVHPDRIKANANGAGPNGTILSRILHACSNQSCRNVLKGGTCKAKAVNS